MSRVRYTVTGPLGRGTSRFRGVAATGDGHRRAVAITRMRSAEGWSPAFRAMLVEDVQSAMGLVHDNIVEVLDLGRTPEDVHYIVAELVDGCDVRTLVARRGTLAIQHALHVVVGCCSGLAHAHAARIVLRDVSPRTLLVSTTSEVKLLEHGMANVNSQRESSEPGVVKGRFNYLSPEQALGMIVDERSDVFAAGIVLWELLAGRGLFSGDTDYQTVEMVRDAHIPVIAGLDPALDAIVRRALARAVDDRFESAAELGTVLAAFAASRGLAADPVELASIVRGVQRDLAADSQAASFDRGTLAQVQADLDRMTSIVVGRSPGDASRWN